MKYILALTWAVGLAGCSSVLLGSKYTSQSDSFIGPGDLKRPAFLSLDSSSSHRPNEVSSYEEDVLPPANFKSQGRRQQFLNEKNFQPRAPFALNWPLNFIKINQDFNPKKKRRPHLGVDLGGTKGTPIFAAHEGVVIYAGRAFRGFGKLVIVEYDDQWASLYAHLDKIIVQQGQIVESGQTLGTMGRTGRATGVHLHFELLQNQRPVDPVPLLNNFQRLVETHVEPHRQPTNL